jgi:hypothetical protein
MLPVVDGKPRRSRPLRRVGILFVTAFLYILTLYFEPGLSTMLDSSQSRILISSCDGALPYGVLSVYPCGGGSRLFEGSGTTRIFVTFIGAFMNDWYLHSLRSLVLVHCSVPGVTVMVWANELNSTWYQNALGDLVAADGSPRVRLVRYNVSMLAVGLPGAEESVAWLTDPARQAMWPAHSPEYPFAPPIPLPGGGYDREVVHMMTREPRPYLVPGAVHPLEPQMVMAHITDVLRMIVLYRFGGVYLDVDILPLRPINDLGTRFAANIVLDHGNYECTSGQRGDWPDNDPVVMPARLGGQTVSCMCVCFLSFPRPGNVLLFEVLARGLGAFMQRGMVYGGFGAWVFMDALGHLIESPELDVRPLAVQNILCWPQVLDMTPQGEGGLHSIFTNCSAVHMMSGGHARKFNQSITGNETLFAQVYTRARNESFIAGSCAAQQPPPAYTGWYTPENNF